MSCSVRLRAWCWVLSDEPYLESENFAVSNECQITEIPSNFTAGVGVLENQSVNVVTRNDSVGNNGFLSRGIYREYTHIQSGQVWIYANKLPNTPITDTVLFVYNVIKKV